MRRVFGERPEDRPLELPVTGASVATTARWLSDRLDFRTDFPLLERALAQPPATGDRADTEAVVGELFDVLARVRLGIDMIERSVDDLPEMAAVCSGGSARSCSRGTGGTSRRSAAGATRP